MLKDALALRERLERRSGAAYAVRRSGRRSLAVSPFTLRAPGAPAMSAPHDPERVVIEALEAAGCHVRGRYAVCPVCGPVGRTWPRTLGFFEMRSGRIWLECFRCRDFGAILDALGLERRDLHAVRFEPPDSIPGRPWPDQRRYPTAYRILEVIHAYSGGGPEGACPSEQTIADRAGFRGVYNRRSVTRWKRWLKDEGFLDWKLEKRDGALWPHCVYRLHVTWTRPLSGALKRLRREKIDPHCSPL